MSLKTGLGGLAFAIAVALAGHAAAATTVSSTFDNDADGWRFGSFQGVGGGTQPVTYDAAGDYISFNSGFQGWGYIAPEKFLGDKTDFIGGSFSLDMSSNFNTYGGKRSLVVFSGGSNQQMFGYFSPGPTTQLTTFSFDLVRSSFHSGSDVNEGAQVSDATFRAIMGNLKQIEIYADWSPTVDSTKLDNVFMTARAPGGVPEPATWAMMILGFGATGTLVRRRRAALAVA